MRAQLTRHWHRGGNGGRSSGRRAIERWLVIQFAGIPSFLRAPIMTDLARLDADIAVLGVPTDEGSPYLPGSRFGPRRIREHSLRFGSSGYYDGREDRTFLTPELEGGRLVDAGDVDVRPTNSEATWANITASLRQILNKGALPVVIGGDHAVSAPIVRAWSNRSTLSTSTRTSTTHRFSMDLCIPTHIRCDISATCRTCRQLLKLAFVVFVTDHARCMTLCLTATA